MDFPLATPCDSCITQNSRQADTQLLPPLRRSSIRDFRD